MEKIILMGAGRALQYLIDTYEAFFKDYCIKGIWDNDNSKTGETISINGIDYVVEKPNSQKVNCSIIITSELHFDDIKKSLIKNNELNLSDSDIKHRNYIFHIVKEKIIERYKDDDAVDIQDTINYLRNNDLEIFINVPEYKKTVENTAFEVSYDEEAQLYYSKWMGKKIYLKREYDTEKKVSDYLKNIYAEQITNSPHCYKCNGYEVGNDDVLVDAGAAEGFFALERVDIVKKVILIEKDEEWVEALKYTFAPYGDKVEIVNKYLSNISDGDNVTLDELDTDNQPITFIKMDIEGAEVNALKDTKFIKLDRNLKIIACTYHYENDEKKIKEILDQAGFETHYSKGYMFFRMYEDSSVTDLRHALCFGKKIKAK